MASYPSTIASFTTKVDGVTTVIAADPNLIQDEVLAIESILGTNPNQSTLASVGAYTSNPISTTFGSVTARIANIEAGLVSSITTGATNTSNITTNTSNISTNTSNITSLTSRMTAAESVNTTQTSNISTNTSNITSLTSRMTAAEATLAGVATATNLTTLTNRVTAVEAVNTTQTSNISTNTSDISTINSTLTGYTTSITTGALITSAASTTAPIGINITQSTNANSKRASIQFGSGWLLGQDSSTSTSGGLKDFFIYDATASAFRIKIGTDGIISTISSLKLRPGTAAAGTAALYFDNTSPALLTTAVAGAMEYDGTNLYFTPSGSARKTVAYTDSSITGNATTATKFASNTTGPINGVNYDGSAGITVKASTTNALGLTSGGNLAFSSGTTWDGGTSAVTIGLSATPTGITSINTVTMPTSGSFVTSTSGTTSILTSVGTLGKLVIGASSGTTPPIKLTAGTVVGQLINSNNGALEYDGRVGYFSPTDTVNGKALLPSTFYWANASSRTLTTVSIANQNQYILGGATGGGVGLQLVANTTYEFELIGNVQLNSINTANTLTLRLNYTGSYSLLSTFSTFGVNTSTPTFTWQQATAGDLDLAIGTLTSGQNSRYPFIVRGIIRTTATSGYFNPLVLISNSSSTGSLTVGSGTYMKITPLGSDSVTSIGLWA